MNLLTGHPINNLMWKGKPDNAGNPTGGEIKENRLAPAALSGPALTALLIAVVFGFACVTRLDAYLPPLLTKDNSPLHKFRGADAYEHLLNLTAIGPRVAGSYENEVAAVAWALRALRSASVAADSNHHRLEVDVQTASGAFPVAFLDGMTNAYRGVQNVVARLSVRGGAARGPTPALLLNCHLDTVPDSPGASDDGAGCAVLAEVARAMASSPRLLRHNVLFLFNGAEENIMQASHAFITQHPWAREVRAFVNLEACGAGGRELLFQAGPHHPWIVEAYADHAPYPYASSLAQEIFESGLIPADTDFRIFRDFGNLSGVDLAWNSNGYVYHTRLDDASRVPPASLQRAGDNVLALATVIVQSDRLSGGGDWDREADSPQPLFFDVLSAFVIRARPPLAAAAAALALAAAALALHLDSRHAARHMYVRPADYWAAAWRGAGRLAAACACGMLASGAVAGGLTLAGATLAWYSRPLLLVPLYVLPTLSAAALVLRALWARDPLAPLLRGWWAWRATAAGALLCWAMLLAACLALRLRSGFVPLLWTAGGAGGALTAHALRLREGRAAAALLAGVALPSLQSMYLSLSSLQTFVPLTGRAGAALPAELAIGALVAALTAASAGWVPALAVATSAEAARRAIGYGLAAGAAAAFVASSPLGFPYTPNRPQRIMLFETYRTLHYAPPAGTPSVLHAYWMPDLDSHSPYSLSAHVMEFEKAKPMSAEECRALLFCGAPYYLPVLSFISHAHWLPAPGSPLEAPPGVRIEAKVWRTTEGPERRIRVNVAGPSHVVVIMSPAAGAQLATCSLTGGAPIEGPRWDTRRTYFFFLHTARGAEPWTFDVDVVDDEATIPGDAGAADAPVDVSVAGHVLFGEHKQSATGRALLAGLPEWTAPTGWTADLHLYRV